MDFPLFYESNAALQNLNAELQNLLKQKDVEHLTLLVTS